jgi:DNA-binding NarL/FixJ family response regulator
MSAKSNDRDSGQHSASRYRIIVTEDDDVVRERFVHLISAWEGGEVVAECATLSDTMAAIKENEIDLLITDLNLPDGNGVEAIRALGGVQPRAEAMVISVLADDRIVLDSIEAGASGYLLKDADPVDLIEAINDLMAGRSPISSRIARVLVKRLAERKARVPDGENAPHMTPREMDILWGIAKGLTSNELAASLGVSRQTVPVHIRNIYKKLQVTNRSEAVFEANRQGIIQL